MFARICDSCYLLIDKDKFIQLTKRELKTNETNDQKVMIIIGDYCNECLENGKAIKDLLNHGTDRTD